MWTSGCGQSIPFPSLLIDVLIANSGVIVDTHKYVARRVYYLLLWLAEMTVVSVPPLRMLVKLVSRYRFGKGFAFYSGVHLGSS